MTNPLETARKNLHKRYQLLAQDLGRVVSMLALHEHTGFKTIQPAIDILQELIAGLTDSEKDLEHGLGLLRSTRDELCAVPKYHDDVELVNEQADEFGHRKVLSGRHSTIQLSVYNPNTKEHL